MDVARIQVAEKMNNEDLDLVSWYTPPGAQVVRSISDNRRPCQGGGGGHGPAQPHAVRLISPVEK